MKIRLDFVTNSSSSSFLCDICGNTEEVYEDAISFWLYCDKCKSTFENRCSGILWPIELIRSIILPQLNDHKAWLEKRYKDTRADIDDRNFKYYAAEIPRITEELAWLDKPDYNNKEVTRRIFDSMKRLPQEMPVKDHCPMCNLKKVPLKAMFAYLVEQTGKTKEEIAADMTSKYGTIERLRGDLKY